MANCDNRCPVYRQIVEIREKCLACRVCEDGNTLQIGGRGAVHADSAESPELVYQHAQRRDTSPSEGVTALPIDIEDRLRELFTTFFGQDDVTQLLITHLAKGGNLADFHEHLRKLTGQLQKIVSQKPKAVKAFAWARFKGAVRAFQPFAAIAGGLIGKGKGGAVVGGRGRNNYQSEFDFGEEPRREGG